MAYHIMHHTLLCKKKSNYTSYIQMYCNYRFPLPSRAHICTLTHIDGGLVMGVTNGKFITVAQCDVFCCMCHHGNASRTNKTCNEALLRTARVIGQLLDHSTPPFSAQFVNQPPTPPPPPLFSLYENKNRKKGIYDSSINNVSCLTC